jgi:hypothetical protein
MEKSTTNNVVTLLVSWTQNRFSNTGTEKSNCFEMKQHMCEQ